MGVISNKTQIKSLVYNVNYYGPFDNCTGLKQISVGGVETLTSGMLKTGSRTLEKLIIRGTVKHIGEKAFDSSGISRVEKVYAGDFYHYESSNGYNESDVASTELIIQEGVESIGAYAFNECKMFTSLTLPSSNISIDDSAFLNCSRLAVNPLSTGAGQTIPDGNYMIASADDPRFYLDIDGGDASASAQTNVAIWMTGDWMEGGELPQADAWTITYISDGGFYKIKQYTGEAYLDVIDPQNGDGQNVQVWERFEYDDEVWSIVPSGNGFFLQSKANGLYATIDGNLAEGSNVAVRIPNSSNKQKWVFIPYLPDQPIDEGKYVLLSTIDSGFELSVSGNSEDIQDGTNVQIWDDNASSQFNSFNVEKLSNGYYSLIHAASGKALTVEGGDSTVGQNITVRSWDGSHAQQWAIIDNDGGFTLFSRCSGHVLDLSGSGAYNGNNIQQWVYIGTNAQKWTFAKAEYTVSYNASSASNVPGSQVKYYGNALTLSNVIPTRTGFIFRGWATTADAETVEYHPGDQYTLNADLTLFAVWQELLPDFILPASLTEIDDEAFAGVAFTYVKLPENAVSIGWHAFADCPNLAYIYIPALTTQIDEEAFGTLHGLTILGKTGTTAETYAQNHHFTFIAVP